MYVKKDQRQPLKEQEWTLDASQQLCQYRVAADAPAAEAKRAMERHPANEKPKRVPGACLCGEVQFEITLPTDFCAHCHCTMCRRNHGAAYVTWVGVQKPQLRIVSGKESLVAYKSSEHGQRSFCKRCGSTLIFESTQYPDQFHLPLANLNGKIDRDPELHVFFDDRADWVKFGDQLPRM